MTLEDAAIEQGHLSIPQEACAAIKHLTIKHLTINNRTHLAD